MQMNLNFMIQITSHKEEKGGIKSSVLSLLTTVKSFEADVSSVSPLSERRNQNYLAILPHRHSTTLSLETLPRYKFGS